MLACNFWGVSLGRLTTALFAPELDSSLFRLHLESPDLRLLLDLVLEKWSCMFRSAMAVLSTTQI